MTTVCGSHFHRVTDSTGFASKKHVMVTRKTQEDIWATTFVTKWIFNCNSLKQLMQN